MNSIEHQSKSDSSAENNPIQQVKPVSEMTKGEIDASKATGDPTSSEFNSGMAVEGNVSNKSLSERNQFDFRKDRQFNSNSNKPKPVRDKIPGVFISLLGLFMVVVLMVLLGIVVVRSLGWEDGEDVVIWIGKLLGVYE